MKNGVCSGKVTHHRMYPHTHKFTYNMSWYLLNLNELEDICNQSRLWSLNKFNLISIHNKDYINSDNSSIKEKVNNFIHEKSGKIFNGEVYLFTHPRYLGYGFNSVSFYLCYEQNKLKYILSEINNTPWKQKHIYLHNVSTSINTSGMNQKLFSFKFNKEFHISPYVDMHILYKWNFYIHDNILSVGMSLSKGQQKILNVSMQTEIHPLNSDNIQRWAYKTPFQSLKMISGIYWQAFLLWIKKTPFYNHPSVGEKNHEEKQ